ncbi:hypothetical protein HRK28_11425 [Rathayibacter sp. VKM Ac-2835]|jgi:hypothetical protein|uniref:hypothetical protein n=1 Tax=Rathayibacter sp. VKM Ac-2835 TaxID=2739043 RepID=UPI00156425BD|nr:hypothetical protein [Rathayibacter sp. VKM Ac-2835]NRG41526.1 hypothetical protein [Rathayibacter sp. VKM Ac-2835]
MSERLRKGRGEAEDRDVAARGAGADTVHQRLAALDRLLGREWRERVLELQVLLRLRRAAEDLDDG